MADLFFLSDIRHHDEILRHHRSGVNETMWFVYKHFDSLYFRPIFKQSA